MDRNVEDIAGGQLGIGQDRRGLLRRSAKIPEKAQRDKDSGSGAHETPS